MRHALAAAVVLAAAGAPAAAQPTPMWVDSPAAWRPSYAWNRPALRMAVGTRATVLWLPAGPRSLDAGLAERAPSPTGVGLEYRLGGGSGNKPSNLLRLQLDARSSLQFRPRSGGLALTYREQF